VGVLTVVILLGFVIPRLVTMFEDMGQALPLPTKILITISSGLRAYWWLIIALIGIAVFLYRRTAQSSQGRALMDNLKLKIIILGDIVLKTQISRLFRTLSLLLSSGVSIVSSLDLATSVVDNQVIKEQMLKFKEQIRSGESLAKCLKDSAVFPEFATNIIRVGEETGAMEKSLKQVADDYERQVDQSLKNISRLVEPAIILVMGLIVGFIVLSMLLPIFQINLIVR
jgi:type II secretory pathway component PulF